MKKIFIVFLSLQFSALFSQEDPHKNKDFKTKSKGFYIVWGYHRDQYTKSTVRFINHNKGNDYDFKLHGAKAHDRLDGHDLFHTPLTVPQYSFNIGYMFGDKKDLGVEFSWDHLKYIVTPGQTLRLTGQIGGRVYDKDTLVNDGFVHFEHTNGNNYAMISLVKRKTLLESKKGFHKISLIGKAGAGGLIPKTDSYIMGKHNDGPFKLSGFVLGASGGVRYDVFKYFFLETSAKTGLALYTNAIIHDKGKAKQAFASIQYMASFGFNIPL